ncbi:MAG: hypothetical protein ACTSUU_03960 [Candidatus Thorarchaeota archaeon]
MSDLAQRVEEMIRIIEEGQTDPVELRLTKQYRELRSALLDLKLKIDIDEMLNEILGTKIHRVSELARFLSAPDLYAKRIEEMSTRELARMVRFRQPLSHSRFARAHLEEAFARVLRLIDAMSHGVEIEEDIPEIVIPDRLNLETEEAISEAELRRIERLVPSEGSIPLRELVASSDLVEFIRRFLCIVILISEARVAYDPSTKSLSRDMTLLEDNT